MRVIQICAVDFTAYHLLGPLMRAGRAHGWTVEFACADGPGAAALRLEGYRHRAIPMTRSVSPLAQLRAAAVLAASLASDRPDVIHTHTPAGGLVGRAAALVVPGVTVVHTLHGLPLEDRPRTAVERAYLVAERALRHRTALFFSQAGGDVARAAAMGIVRPRDTIVIGNGTDIQRFRPDGEDRRAVRAELGVPPDATLVLGVGRLVREKGWLDLADAACSLRAVAELHVAIAGSALPSDRSDVTADLAAHPAAAALGDRWRLLGYRADVDRLLGAADVFVLPSWREGLPRSVIEAMASGLPVVATDIPACRELVEEGVTGLLFPPHDVAALARDLRALGEDAEMRDEMGRRARALAEERHDERRVIALQLEAIDRLVAR